MARFITKRRWVEDPDAPQQQPRPQRSQLHLRSTTVNSVTQNLSRGQAQRQSRESSESSQSQSSEDLDEMETSAKSKCVQGNSDEKYDYSDFDDQSSLSDGSYYSSSDDMESEDDFSDSDDLENNEYENDGQYIKEQSVGRERASLVHNLQANSANREYKDASDNQDSEESDSSDYDHDYSYPDISDPDWDDSCDYKLEFPNVMPDEQYHPEHPFVRSRVDGLYYELCGPRQLSMPNSTSSATSPRKLSNIQQLVDTLIQTHLPQFWHHREQDKNLNRFSGLTAQNSRPHQNALFVTCVDCGYKFHKQPLYESPATERHNQKKARELANRDIEINDRRRSPWKERKPIKAVDLFQRLNGEPIRSDSFSQSEIQDILNNNRKSKSYDGNMDYIGLKEEGHPADCPRNRASKKHGTKLHFGWELVLGHDHSHIPTFPRPMIHKIPEKRSAYYPARSLMASFTHILPRGQTLSQNQIRKLFAYFIWHRWFDCDLQAMTLRKAYTELWPLFMLRDEEPELTSQDITNFRSSGPSKKRVAKAQLRADNRGNVYPNKNTLSSLKSEYNETSSSDRSDFLDKHDLTPVERAARERSRLLSMEQRCTTLLNIGLMNHGVDTESRHLSVQERVRRDKEVGKGWVLGYSEHLRNDVHNLEDTSCNNDGRKSNSVGAHKVKVAHKIHEYTARAKDTPTSGNNPLVQRLTNPEFTRPNEPDALEALTRRLNQLSKRADARRQQLGFALPEYMVPIKKKNKVTGTRVWLDPMTTKRIKASLINAKEIDNAYPKQVTSHSNDPAYVHPAPLVSISAPQNSHPSTGPATGPLHSTQEHFQFIRSPSQEQRDNEMAFESLCATVIPQLQTIPTTSNTLALSSINNIVYNQQGGSYNPLQLQVPSLYNNYGTNLSYNIDYNSLIDIHGGTSNQRMQFQTYDESPYSTVQPSHNANLSEGKIDVGMVIAPEQIGLPIVGSGEENEDDANTNSNAEV
ncbi:hypothetical protein BGZ76_010082 [Entomortierella beljakovae]|nr:hypothetical protein BGZ76_010082 [Entomortierella beljakovae]